jgi:hypothetical protein
MCLSFAAADEARSKAPRKQETRNQTAKMKTMSSSDPRPITGDERAQMRQWLGEVRWQRIRSLTDDGRSVLW